MGLLLVSSVSVLVQDPYLYVDTEPKMTFVDDTESDVIIDLSNSITFTKGNRRIEFTPEILKGMTPQEASNLASLISIITAISAVGGYLSQDVVWSWGEAWLPRYFKED
jgi:hypothetical protein